MSSYFAILGAGSWGTALAVYINSLGHKCALWARDDIRVSEIAASGVNKKYLPDVEISENISVTKDFARACSLAEYIVIAVPSKGFSKIINDLRKIIKSNQKIIVATKGLEHNSKKLLSTFLEENIPNKFIFLQGPSFAVELANFQITGLTLASGDTAQCKELKSLLKSDCLVIELHEDIVGVQVAGIMKNIFAIVFGIIEVNGYSANTRSALITLFLKEMCILGTNLGAKNDTLISFAGVGDLILTVSDDKSRNKRFGKYLGQGISLQESKEKVGQVVEGLDNLDSLISIAQQKRINLPICKSLWSLINSKSNIENFVINIFRYSKL